MTAQIQNLIDKVDTFEAVRDQIAIILQEESIAQQALADTAGKDPLLWALDVTTERTNPWEKFLNINEETTPAEIIPIVNIWFDSETFNDASSNNIERQKAIGSFNIDCYAIGISQDEGAGHLPGDKASFLEVQRVLRLVRNILMASSYTYLDLRGVVFRRMPRSITQFQPEFAESAQKIAGARLNLEVEYNEFSPQYEGPELELISAVVKRRSDDKVLIEADYAYPIT